MANKALADWYNTTTENIVGLTDADLNPNQEIVDYILRQDQKVLKSGKEDFTKEERIISPKGELEFYQTFKIPFMTTDKDIPALLGVAINITEAKMSQEALRESEYRHRKLLSTTAEGIWVLNPDKVTIEVNDAMCRLIGYKREEILGKTPFDFVDEENKKIFLAQTSKIPSTENRSYEITLKKKDGDDLNVIINATTLFDENSEVIAAYAFVNDITERKHIENKLRESENQLSR
jgi:PAS domain S-box-containing protein